MAEGKNGATGAATPSMIDETELARMKSLPQCRCCGKLSDAAKDKSGVTLCGTDFDAWMRSPEKARYDAGGNFDLCYMDWERRVQAERRKL